MTTPPSRPRRQVPRSAPALESAGDDEPNPPVTLPGLERYQWSGGVHKSAVGPSFLAMRFATAAIVILVAAVVACADPPAATRTCAPRFVTQAQDVPGVRMALPPEPRPWDTSPT